MFGPVGGTIQRHLRCITDVSISDLLVVSHLEVMIDGVNITIYMIPNKVM